MCEGTSIVIASLWRGWVLGPISVLVLVALGAAGGLFLGQFARRWFGQVNGLPADGAPHVVRPSVATALVHEIAPDDARDEVPTATATATTAAAAERRTLIEACIRLRSLVSDAGLREILDDALSSGGVVAMIPTGEKFDPSLHHSIGVVMTTEPRLDMTIATTDKPGYMDHGRVIQAAEVSVHRYTEGN
jgi:molecular chaperone GrpE